MKKWLVIIIVLAGAGCNRDPRTLSKQELERALCEQVQFAKVELQPIAEHEYIGTATELNGTTCDLKIKVARDYVNWQASTKPVPISKEKIEQLVAKWLQLTDFTMEPNGADWKGKGTTNGREVAFQIRVEDGQIHVESTTDKDRKTTIQTSTVEQKTRSGGFKP